MKVSSRIKNLVGMKFNRLTVIKEAGRQKRSVLWECRCDCGNITYATGTKLKNGSKKSCGCLISESRFSSKAIEKGLKGLKDKYLKEGTNLKLINKVKPIKSNKSGYTGVHWDNAKKLWIARIEFKGKRYHLGGYKNKEEAIKVRKEAEEKIFGEFLKIINQDI